MTSKRFKPKFSLFVLVVLVPALVGMAIIFGSWLSSSSQEMQVTEEARWLSRYLHQSKSDYLEAERLLRTDPPNIGVKFLENWEPVVESSETGRYAIARRSKRFSGRTLVIWNDLTFSWTDDSMETE